MILRTNVGKVAAAIESGKRAAQAIDYGPINTLSSTSAKQSRIIADWHEVNNDAGLFIWGISDWQDNTLRVSK